jgi:hypothetical protein
VWSSPVTQWQSLMAKTDRPLLRRGRNLLAHFRPLCPSRTDLIAVILNYSPSRPLGTIRELKDLPSPSLRLRAAAAESPRILLLPTRTADTLFLLEKVGNMPSHRPVLTNYSQYVLFIQTVNVAKKIFEPRRRTPPRLSINSRRPRQFRGDES